jgi:Mn-dependent DtxR family transcriptional regulator
MKAYKGTFLKKDGERRAMRFLKINDLPKNFMEGKIKGNQKHKLAEGMELVWDIDESDFRIFNHNMRVDNIEEFEYTLR